MLNLEHYDWQEEKFAADVECIKAHYASQLTHLWQVALYYRLEHTLTEVLMQSINRQAPEPMRQEIMAAFKHRFRDFEWRCCN